MKRIIVSISVMFFVFGCFYLMGAFSNHSFDLRKWGNDSLDAVSSFGGLISLALGVVTFFYDEIKN